MKIEREGVFDERRVEEWNKNYKIGIDVEVMKDDGSTIFTKTRSLAWVLGGHTPVILLEGISGCYALERVSPFDKTSYKKSHSKNDWREG